MTSSIIHVARIQPKGLEILYLFLKKTEEKKYRWFAAKPPFETQEKTPVIENTVEEAIFHASKHWSDDNFRTLSCGFQFSLPYRDPVGKNALFWQMALAYESPNGKYFDPDEGSTAFIDFASEEALTIWRQIKANAL